MSEALLTARQVFEDLIEHFTTYKQLLCVKPS
jgi:hypothetical protein